MTKEKFKTKIELTKKTNEVIIPLHAIGVNDKFQYARFTVKCLEIHESPTVFAGFSLQVGKDDTWATWLNITDIWHVNMVRHTLSVEPAHPSFKKLRIRAAADTWELPDGFKAVFHVEAEVEIAPETPPPPPPPPPSPPEPPTPPSPSPPSEPFNVGMARVCIKEDS